MILLPIGAALFAVAMGVWAGVLLEQGEAER